MLEVLKQKLFGVKEVVGVELDILQDGSYSIRFVELLLNGDLIRTGKSHVSLTKVSQLKNSIDEGVPVVLVVNGKGVIYRQLDLQHETETARLQKVLPNASIADFYLETLNISQFECVAIARKGLIDAVIDEFIKEEINIVDIHIGPLVINSVAGLFSSGNNELVFGLNKVMIKDGKIISFQKLEESITENDTTVLLRGISIKEKLLLSYSIAFGFLLGNEKSGIEAKHIQHNFNEMVEKLKFKLYGWCILFGFLVILIINFIIHSYYHHENISLGHIDADRITTTKIESLRKELSKKELQIKESSVGFAYNYSFLSDRIAASVPMSIQLDELTINPLDDRTSKEQKRKIFQNDLVHIKGRCKDIGPLNAWAGILTNLPFVSEVSVTRYRFDEQEQEGMFEISMNLKM